MKVSGERTREVTLDPGDLCGHSGQKPRARRSLPGPDAGHPLQAAGGHCGNDEDQGIKVQLSRDRGRRARCVPDRPVSGGNLRSLADSLMRRLTSE